jgi:hypothetical protein
MAGVVSLISLNEAQARSILGSVCVDSSRVFFSRHAEERMVERDITRSQVFTCLKNGVFIEGPARGSKGNWEFKLEVHAAGDVIRVVAALDSDNKGDFVVVITSYFGN